MLKSCTVQDEGAVSSAIKRGNYAGRNPLDSQNFPVNTWKFPLKYGRVHANKLLNRLPSSGHALLNLPRLKRTGPCSLRGEEWHFSSLQNDLMALVSTHQLFFHTHYTTLQFNPSHKRTYWCFHVNCNTLSQPSFTDMSLTQFSQLWMSSLFF